MIHRLAGVTAVIVTGVLVLGGAAGTIAQTQAPAPAPATPAGSEQSVQGKIKAVDASGRVMVLDDGTRLILPSTARVDPEELKPGTMVKVSYQTQSGLNVVTEIEIQK